MHFYNIYSDNKMKLINTGFAICAIGATWYLVFHLYKRISYSNLIKRKQAQLKGKKNCLSDHLKALNKPSDLMEEIVNTSVEGLNKGIELGRYKPIDVLHAYQGKALLMDDCYNFITDLNPNAESDVLESKSITKNSVLKGIPISVKDMLYVKDCDCTNGMPSLCLKPAMKDCVIVTAMRMQGAVPFLLTNMCQTGKSIESSNPIFGQTLNPHNKLRTAGGSSGGEGAILGAKASLIGLGSDIGGSIRIPAAYCGIFGLKPTSCRVSRRHVIRLYPNQNFILFSIGPMARTFEDLLILFKAMASPDMYRLDPYSPPLCFNEQLFSTQKPLRIGYYFHLGGDQITPIPSVVRAVNLAKTALSSCGHTLVEFSLPSVDNAVFELYLACLFTDGGYGFIDKLMKENPVDSSLSVLVFLLKLPNIVKRIASFLVSPFNKSYSRSLKALAGVRSVHNLWQLRRSLEEYRETVLSKWQAEKLDGLICPVLPITAPLCNTSKYVTEVIGYTAIYNVLDYPAGSVPVTKVTESDLEELARSYPRDSVSHRRIRDLQVDSVGMPVGVQCVALPWRDELCLRIMRDVSRHSVGL